MKRRSITKPPDTTFFTDEDTGVHRNACLPKILIDAGLNVVCHEEVFPPKTPDHEWLRFCGEQGLVAVTHDKRIRLSDRSIASLVGSGARVLTLIGQWTHEELAINLVNSVYRVERIMNKHDPPFIAKLHMAAPSERARARSGKVELYRSKEDLLREATRNGPRGTSGSQARTERGPTPRS